MSRKIMAFALFTALAIVTASGLIAFRFYLELETLGQNSDLSNSKLLTTSFGALEYAEHGAGPAFLMIHGTGGGFDQGLLFAKPLIDKGFRVIAPSRFGYLRSAIPDDPSPENQADALAEMLDQIGIDQIAVAGGSAGALTALQFAIRHPEKCAALFPIVPATYAPNRPPARPWSRFQTFLASKVLGSDFLFWAAIKLAKDQMLKTLLATDPELVSDASPAEQTRVDAILYGILPVSRRAKGLLNDARQAGDPPPMELGRIKCPTLTISLEDDRFLTADAARHIAASVEGARLLVYPSGGHVWVGRNEELFGEIQRFLNAIVYVKPRT